MGWIVLVAVKPLFAALGGAGFSWLLAGGICYTVGIVFSFSTTASGTGTASGTSS